MEDLARQADEAVGKGNVKELYSITRTLAGVGNTTDRPVRVESGEMLCSLIRRPAKNEGRTLQEAAQ